VAPHCNHAGTNKQFVWWKVSKHGIQCRDGAPTSPAGWFHNYITRLAAQMVSRPARETIAVEAPRLTRPW
jgi:hypothetical protein